MGILRNTHAGPAAFDYGENCRITKGSPAKTRIIKAYGFTKCLHEFFQTMVAAHASFV